MANIDNPKGFRYYKSLLGGTSSPPTVEVTVAASQTLAIGDPLIFSSGQVTIATTSSGSIAGIAMEASTTGAGETDTILMIPTYPWIAFKIQTVTGTAYATASHLYNDYDLTVSTGVCELNIGSTTEKVFRILGRADNSAVGEHAEIWGVFIRSAYCGNLHAVT